MPNWCMNKLTIKGETARLEEFRKHAEGKRPAYSLSYEEKEIYAKINDTASGVMPVNVLQFHNFIPVPEEILRKGYDEAGYDWERSNWGVKWGACDASIEDAGRENELVYVFNTPWRDPYNWLEATAKQYPDLKFRLEYEELGIGFEGFYVFYKGQLKSKKYTESYGEEDDE